MASVVGIINKVRTSGVASDEVCSEVYLKLNEGQSLFSRTTAVLDTDGQHKHRRALKASGLWNGNVFFQWHEIAKLSIEVAARLARGSVNAVPDRQADLWFTS